MQKTRLPPALHWLLCCLPALPLAWLLWQGMQSQLGPDPGKALVHGLGVWALRLLLLTLAITPLQRLTPVLWLPLRRVVGLWTLAYATLHVLAYDFFYLGFEWRLLGSELVKRPYIWPGAIALALLCVLGITSTRRWQQRLGRRWKQLHRSIYAIAVLAIVHFGWQVKAGLGDAPWYALTFVLLLALRRLPSSRAAPRMAGSKSGNPPCN